MKDKINPINNVTPISRGNSYDLKPAGERRTILTVVITPEQAEKILKETAEAGFYNRAEARASIATYANDIREGRWFTDTFELLKFSILDGKQILIDGQHRLEAVIKAGKAQSFWAVFDVPYAAFRHFDQGNSRDVKDILYIEDQGNKGGWQTYTSDLARTGRYLWRRGLTGDPLTNPEAGLRESEGNIADAIRASFNDLPATREKYHDAALRYRQTGNGPYSAVVFLLYEWTKIDPKLTDIVANWMATDDNRPNTCFRYARDYAAASKAKSEEHREDRNQRAIAKGRHRDYVRELMKAYIVAWNYARAGKEVTQATFNSNVRKLKRVPLAQ